MKHIGYWWNDDNIELVDIEGTVFALNGWNGEKFLKCWIATGEYLTESSEEEYILTPIYEEISEDEFEIVNYEVSNT